MKKAIVIIICLFTVSLANAQCASGNIASDKDFRTASRYISRNNTEKISAFIKSGKNINAKDNNGRNLLMFSLQNNNSEIAELLISAGADLKLVDNANNNCLLYSIENCKNLDITYKLIDKGADINQPNSKLFTPFLFSILYKCPELPFFLIEKNVDYKAITISGTSGLHLATVSGCDALFNYLLEKGLDYNKANDEGDTPLLLAIKYKRSSIASMLINLGANVKIVNQFNYTPILFAINNLDTLIFDKLIEKGAKLDEAYSNDSLVPALNETITEINAGRFGMKGILIPPIYLAASKENEYFVGRLLEKGIQNPMKCDDHESCYLTAFIYSVSAENSKTEEKLNLFQNSLNIYNLAKEKYKDELNRIRARNTAKVAGQCCVAGLTGTYVSADYETERINYLKFRIDKCEKKIEQIQLKINSLGQPK